MGRVHIFAQYGDDPAGPPVVTDSSETGRIVGELEAGGAQVVVLDDNERVTYGLLTKDLAAAHPELLPQWNGLLASQGDDRDAS